MKRFARLDVSLSTMSICVVAGQGHIVFEGVVTTDPDAIGAVLAPHRADLVELEAGPMSEWLHTGLSRYGLDGAHGNAACACGVQGLAGEDRSAGRLRYRPSPPDGLFRRVHVKTASARERRLPLGARDARVRRLRDLDNSVRGLLRGLVLRPPRLVRERWSGTVRQLITAQPMLMAIDPILVTRDRLCESSPPGQAGSRSGTR